MPREGDWWLYMVECRGGGIYTGIAKDVDARYRQHEAGKGARYTRMNPPVALLANCQWMLLRKFSWAEVPGS